MGYSAGATGAAAAAAAIAQAIKASGAIVQLDQDNFMKIVGRAGDPVVVCATAGVFTKKYRYLTSYKGLFFYTQSKKPLSFSGKVESVVAEKIWIPG
jgi:ethanolamine utilization cobalamin adenosyltransferase